MDTWGTYERTTTNPRTKESTTDTVTLQADPVNRARYEAKGFTFKEVAPTPGLTEAVTICGPEGQSAAVQMFGFKAGTRSDLDQAAVVKQAVEVAMRKITGTYTQEEAVAAGEAEIASTVSTDGATAPAPDGATTPASPDGRGRAGRGAPASAPPAS